MRFTSAYSSRLFYWLEPWRIPRGGGRGLATQFLNARMGAAGLILVLYPVRDPVGPGFWTPATLVGGIALKDP
jgi:hypothetical protein